MNPTKLYPPRRVLVPVDGSEAAKNALAFARILHERHGSELHVLHAFHLDLPSYFLSGQVEDLLRATRLARDAAEKELRLETAILLGYEAEVHMSDAHPAEAIIEASARLGAGLVVMGTHGRRGTGRFLLGSVAERVMRSAAVPVLAVRQTAAAKPFDHVFCPFNFSPVGRAALEYAVQIAETEQARLTIMHAHEEGTGPLRCDLVEEPMRKRCTVEEVILGGEAAGTILQASRDSGTDLIVMGGERKSSVFGELFSGTTEKVMQLAHAPLLIVPPAGTQE